MSATKHKPRFVGFKIAPGLYKQLRRAADQGERTVSQEIRLALRNHLDGKK